MATKRFSPSLLGIPEEESHISPEQMYDFPLGPASSRRNSMISLKRENSRRKIQQCTGCPGCEPQDLKSLCGRLPEFPSIAICQSCSGSTSSVSESKQQSIRKWLEDVPILKVSNDEELSEGDVPPAYKRLRPSKSTTSSTASERSRASLPTSPSLNYKPNKPKKEAPTIETIVKTKSPTYRRHSKPRAPPPPIPAPNPKKTNEETFKPNLTNYYDVIRNVSPSNKSNLPPPDMINEAMVVDKAEEDVPQVTKQMMAAVINEFASHVGRDTEKKKDTISNMKNIEYETDSLERNGKIKNGYSTPTDYGDISSSQPSPNLSNALPLDEEMAMGNEILNVQIKNNKLVSTKDYEEHQYELIVLNRQNKKASLDGMDKKLFRLPEILQRTNGYNLVSEVYVNNGYNFGSSPSTPTESNASTLENSKPKIRYEQPEKPGHLTIEVEDCPDNYIRVEDSDNFEPDTLDRKSAKFKLSTPSDGTCSSDYIDSLERPRQILLKTTGSFKSDTLNNASEIGHALNSNFNRTFGSLREIYEAKAKSYLRPSLENINFMNTPIHSPSDTLQKTLSWKKNKEIEEGRLLTLEERQKKRQRTSPKGTVKQIPPDVIPPSPTLIVNSPIYEHPKPPRKVIPKHDKLKPPLPPKNGIGRNTSLHKPKSPPISSPSSTISFKLASPLSGVSAHNTHPSIITPKFDEEKDKSILKNFIHTDDVVFKNGINSQFILHAKPITASFNLSSKFDTIKLSPLTSFATPVKKVWSTAVSPTQQKEDSGYLSTDSNESHRNKKKEADDKESETDGSLEDAHSESGAESVETHSVFFGTYRKFSRVTESIDSGVGSDSFRGREQCSTNRHRSFRLTQT